MKKNGNNLPASQVPMIPDKEPEEQIRVLSPSKV